jgi:peroxiredoxin Q/BCP
MEVNDRAPDFSLSDQNGNSVSLKGLRGKTVVLFFFPKADTPG